MSNKLLSNKEGRILSINIFSLGALQFANYFLPFITFPYIALTLGPEKFGIIALANATVVYFSLITDYGFNLTATQSISRSRDSQEKINNIFSSVMCIKTFLMMISVILFLLLIVLVPKISNHWPVFVIAFGTVLGQMLLPLWLFHGLEDMKFVAFISVINKICFTFCVFIFVQSEDDYLLIPFFLAIGSIIIGLISLWIAKNKLGVSFIKPTFNQIKFHFIEGWYVFASTLSISLYASSSIFILGLSANNNIVGLYAAADKLIQVAKGIYTPISQALFPLVSKKINDNRDTGLAFLKKAGLLSCVTMFLVCFLIFMFGENLILILLGDKYKGSVEILKILAFIPFIITLSNLFGIQGLLNLGYRKEFTLLVAICAIFGISLTVILTKLYLSYGTAIALLMSEILIALLLGVVFLIKLKRSNL